MKPSGVSPGSRRGQSKVSLHRPTEHVPRLTLEPVGHRVDVHTRFHRRELVHVGADSKPLVQLNAEQVVHHSEAQRLGVGAQVAIESKA